MSDISQSRFLRAASGAAKFVLGLGLVGTGVAHLTFGREQFRTQVPNWIPLPRDRVIQWAGFAEIGFGVANLLVWHSSSRRRVGSSAAAHFMAFYPDNLPQFAGRLDALGMGSENRRFFRLLLQPLFAAAALMGGHNTRRQRVTKESPDTAPMSVSELDLHRYLGLWYEIGRLPQPFEPRDGTDITAHYSLNNDGTVAVVNTVATGPRWPRKKSTVKRARGQAIAVPEHAGRLRVSFLPRGLRWLPGTRADYWVLRIDRDYRVALVGAPHKKYLWLLSRTPKLSPLVESDYLESAKQQGYNLNAWIRPKQYGA